MTWACPFCGRPIMATETTSPRARSFGLTYLRLRCLPCDLMIEAAGEGRPAAEAALAQAVERRRGTTPDAWRIQPRGAGPRRR